MATHTKQAAKPTKNAKPASVAKKAAPVKKATSNSKPPAAAPKKAPAKPIAKAAPAKKAAAPAKKPMPKPAAKAPAKAPVKPVAKSAPAKKAAPIKKTATNNNQKTVIKKSSKPAPPPAKKSAPVAAAKKAAPVAKKAAPAAPVKKAAPAKAPVKPVAKAAPAKPAPKAPVKPAPKAAPAKPVAKAPAKPVAKAAPAKPAAKAAPAAPAKKAPAAPAAPVKKAPTKKEPPRKILTSMPVKAGPPVPKPMATPAARSLEKKPTVIIAHRKLENKSKGVKESIGIATHYQPDTYRSILDEPIQAQGPQFRYSDEELGEFKTIIVSRIDAARKELNYLQGLITRKDEAGTEDTENRYMNMEDGSGAMEREQLAQLASRQIQFMGHLEKALVRIENKTYGICRVTGKLIDKARLRAVPHATLSIEAKKLMNTKSN